MASSCGASSCGASPAFGPQHAPAPAPSYNGFGAFSASLQAGSSGFQAGSVGMPLADLGYSAGFSNGACGGCTSGGVGTVPVSSACGTSGASSSSSASGASGGWRSGIDEAAPPTYVAAPSTFSRSSIAKQLSVLFDERDSRESSLQDLTTLQQAALPRRSHDEAGTASASASTSEASACAAEAPSNSKLSIDLDVATASLADQLAAVCCSPPRHQSHLPHYRGSSPERAPWE